MTTCNLYVLLDFIKGFLLLCVLCVGSTEPPPSGASSTESGISTVKIYLRFKRYIFDTEKKMIQ